MSKPKILYVDDEQINLLLFEAVLEKKYKVITAYSGIEGLDLLTKHSDIRVVVSDMKMPSMTGLEFVNKAKEILPEIYCYLLTGFDVSRDIYDAINKGYIRKYFQKPFNMNEISAEIESVLSE